MAEPFIYRQALEFGMELARHSPDGITSQLKEGARLAGIDYGPEMEKFIQWAYEELNIK